MQTTSNTGVPFSQLLPSWATHQISQAMAAIMPAHRASHIAAAVAASGNPSGACDDHAECRSIEDHTAATGSGLELCGHPAARRRHPDAAQRNEAVSIGQPMRPADGQDAFLAGFPQLIADEGFAISMLSAVLAAVILAFGFGASADIVVTMLIVGAATAVAETRLRARR
jgi:hypothetical protein